MNVKKSFQPLVEFLAANKDKKVNKVMDEILSFCESKSAGGGITTHRRDEDGVVTHIKCYYFKKWLPVVEVTDEGSVDVYGVKANSASGYSTLSKKGTSAWTSQQQKYRKAKETLLDDIAVGKVNPEDITRLLDEYEQERKLIHLELLGDTPAFDTLEDALAAG